MTERLVLIDSNSLIYRAFFAVPPLTTTKGELANATFGFASILLKSIEQTSPQHLAAAFDLPLPTFRHERDATYKATRRPMPDELRPQIERVKELLGKFGIPMYSLPGYEADDVIGALARQAEKAGVETIIVSGDLDRFRDRDVRSLVPRLRPADGTLSATTGGRGAAPPVRGQLSLGLEAASAVAPPVETALVADVDADAVARELRAVGAVAVHADVDATGRHPALVGLGLAAGERAWYLATPDGVPGPIAALLRDEAIAKTAHDAKTARRALRRSGADLGGLVMDTMIASYLVNASRRYHGLEDLAAERLKLEVPVLAVPDRKDPYRTPTLDERLARAGAGAVAAARLGEQFAVELERPGLERPYRDVELPLADVLVEMEEAGIAVDVAYLHNLGEEFAREGARIEQEAFAAVGHDFGLNSPKQLQSLLFEALKLPRGRRTGTGFSTDATVLEELRGAHPVIEK